MNESQILKEHQISKQTQNTDKLQILKDDQIFIEGQITS